MEQNGKKTLISMDWFFPEHLKTRWFFGCGIWRSHNAGPTFPWGWIGSTNPRETVRRLKPPIKYRLIIMDPLIIDPLIIDSNIEITTDLPLNHRKKKNVLGKCRHWSWLKSLMFCDCWFQISENHQRHLASPVLVQNHPPNSWDTEPPKKSYGSSSLLHYLC